MHIKATKKNDSELSHTERDKEISPVLLELEPVDGGVFTNHVLFCFLICFLSLFLEMIN